jgi:hypothetical protein
VEIIIVSENKEIQNLKRRVIFLEKVIDLSIRTLYLIPQTHGSVIPLLKKALAGEDFVLEIEKKLEKIRRE